MSASTGDAAAALAASTLDLVRIPSPSGAEDAAADYVEARLREALPADAVARHGRAVVARLGAERPRLVLAGHLDTVPENGNFAPEIKDGDVLGLGATDMKGALAVMLALADARAGAPDPSLGFVFYDNEETAYATNGLRRLFEREPWLGEAGLAVLLEPTGNVVELGCLGTLHARVVFPGVAAHSARPWTGKNAIHAAAPFLTRLAGLGEREVADGPARFREVVNATLAGGGTARNVIPSRFEVNVNFRFAPDRTPEEARDHVRSLVPPEAEVTIVDLAPAAAPHGDHPLVRRLVEAAGVPPRGKQAWTDVAQFAERGVPAVNYGPGIPELAHKAEERVPVANLAACYRTLQAFLASVGAA